MRVLVLLAALAGCARDVDGDGYHGDDCDDLANTVHPEAEETCNGVDDDCDGHIDEDVAFVAYWDRDADGFGDPDKARRVCALPADGALTSGDCDDSDATVSPNGVEVCDSRDNDCDGTPDDGVTTTWYADGDADGHGRAADTTEACAIAPPGYAPFGDDCDDSDPIAWADAPELCDEHDNDCDGTTDEDLPPTRVWIDGDGDGAGDPNRPTLACGPITGTSDAPSDCDDSDPAIGPEASEIAGNGGDEDCDGWTDEIAVPDHYADVDAALDAASPGDVVQLGAGTWFVNLDLVGRGLILAGEGCGQTVLYGDGDGPVITTAGGWITEATISGGRNDDGGGVVVLDDTLISNACIQGNSASDSGGGVAVYAGTATLDHVLIAQNTAATGGGAVYVAQLAEADIVNSAFIANDAVSYGGALYAYDGTLRVSTSSFLDNTAKAYGGAVAVRKTESGGTGALFATNVTFDKNYTPNYGQAVYLANLPGTLDNVVLTRHTGSDLPVIYSSSPTTLLTFGAVASWGNRGQESSAGWRADAVRDRPRWAFRDETSGPEAQDVRLLVGSAWIDAGTGLDPDGTAADLGAFGGPDAVAGFDGGYRGDWDGDGLFDLWETASGTNPWEADAHRDGDADGLDAASEQALRTDATDSDSDDDGVSDGDEVDGGLDPSSPADQAPVADAGSPGWALVGEPVSIGSGRSNDPNGDALTYGWAVLAVPAGSTVTAPSDPTAAVTAFTPDVEGPYTLELTVSDGLATASHQVVVNAFDAWIVPDDAASVVDAAALASDGDAIAVRPGTWTGAVDLGGKSLVIFGLGDAGEVVLDADGEGPVIDAAAGEHPTLAHLTLTGGVADLGAGVHALSGGFDLDTVIVTGNIANLDGGGLWASTGDVRISDSRIADNTAGRAGGGAFIDKATLDVVRSSFVRNRAETQGGGLYAMTPTGIDHSVRNTLFLANQASSGAAVFRTGSGARLDLHHSVLANNAGGSATFVSSGELWAFDDAMYGNQGDAAFDRNVSLTNIDVLYPALWGNDADFGSPSDEVGPHAVLGDPRLMLFTDAIDPGADRFVARLGSPVIDAGHPEVVDVDGGRADIDAGGGPDGPRDARTWTIDTDSDGLADGWERATGLDPAVADAAGDPDADGLDNAAEYAANTDPSDPDTDADGVTDGAEIAGGFDPSDPSDHRPTADAGDDQIAEVGTLVTLDGSGSHDPDGDALISRWRLLSRPAGSALATTDIVTAGATAALTPDVHGTFVIGLRVSDGYTWSPEATVEVAAWQELAVPGDFSTLADALAAASAHDVILLGEGTFDGPFDPAGLDVTVAGQGVALTTLRGTSAGPVITVENAETLTLRDLTITGGAGDEGGAVRCDGSAVVGERLSLTGNVAYRGAGVAAVSACTLTFTDVDASGNAAYDKGAAMYVYSSSVTWNNGTIAGNSTEASVAAGIYSYLGTLSLSNLLFRENVAGTSGSALYASSSTSTLDHLTVDQNEGTTAAVLFSSGTASVTNTLITRNDDYGLESVGGASITGGNNGYYGNTRGPTYPTTLKFSTDVSADPIYGDDTLRLGLGSPMIDAGTGADPDGSTADIGVWAGAAAGAEYDLWYRDLDGDGLADGFEQRYGLDETDPADGSADPDADTLSTLDEQALGTSPVDADSDADGVDDDVEEAAGDDPLDATDNAPASFAGPNKNGAVDATFTMFGIGVDPNGDAVTYSWSLEAAPGRSALTSADIGSANKAASTFVPDVPGTYRLMLTVSDGSSEGTDVMLIVASGDVYVPDDYDTVTEAANAAATGSTIHIAAGTYEASGIDLSDKALTFAGEGSDLTEIDCGYTRAFLAADGEDLALSGLTITHGLATRGGVAFLEDGTLTADDVIFSANRASDGGAVNATDTTVTLTDVSFLDNATARDGGGISLVRGTLDAARLVLAGNLAGSEGGGLYSSSGTVTITNAVMNSNEAYNGGALHLRASATVSATLAHVTGVGNIASYGGFVYDAGVPLTVTDSILAHNSKYAYAMVYLDADADGTGDSTLDQSTSDLWKNYTGTDTKEVYLSSTALCCTPVAGTDGNLAVDPLFVDFLDDGDWTNDDLTLGSGSPAMDVGSDLDTDGSIGDLGAWGGPSAWD